MPSAILTHGGGEAGFNPRIRIPALGAWDWFPDNSLLNTDRDLANYDLAGNRKEELGGSYGLGYVGGRCILVFRQLQVWEENPARKYPYTLMLDLGEEIWNRIGWDAASVVSLLESDSTTGAEETVRNFLIRRPEEIVDAGILASICSRIPNLVPAFPQDPVPISEQDEACNIRLRHAWAGSVIEDSLVEMSLSDIGFDRRPSPFRLTAAFQSVPVCLKVARGWMLGGASFAGAIGAGLVVTEVRGQTPKDAIDRIMASGKCLLTGWKAAESHPDTALLMSQLGGAPIWAWEGREARSFLINIALLGELKLAGDWGRTADQAIGEGILRDPELSSIFRDALDDLLAKDDAPLGGDATKFAVKRLSSGKPIQESDLALVGRLHPETLVEMFGHGGIPESWRANGLADAIPGQIQLKIWQRQLQEASPEAVLPLFERALQSSGALQGDELADFIELALDRASEEQGRTWAVNQLLNKAADMGADMNRLADRLIRLPYWSSVNLSNKKRLGSKHDGWRALACLEVFRSAIASDTYPHDPSLDPSGILPEKLDPTHRFTVFWEEVRRMQILYRGQDGGRNFKFRFKRYFQQDPPLFNDSYAISATRVTSSRTYLDPAPKYKTTYGEKSLWERILRWFHLTD